MARMISLRFVHLTSTIRVLVTSSSAEKVKNLRISLYITIEDDVEDDIVYGFKRESSNLTSINYWIQESITSNKLPDLSDWEEVKKKD